MNIAELYALTSGQKIGKIHINEKFYSIPFEKFIIFAPFSKPSKNYSYWIDVLAILSPVLEENGIKIIQVGAANEPKLPFCHYAAGATNWGQLQYLISKSILVLSTDTATAHLAGHYNKPLVDLISNNFRECVSPFYGDKSQQIILEPDRTNKNPSFSLDEGENKQIDEINPEDIAHDVLKLLGFDFEIKYKTLHIGREYKVRAIESVPDLPINISNLGIQSLIVRMDYLFNEQVLFDQIRHCKTTIVTDRPLNPQLLLAGKPNIVEVVYNLRQDPKPDPKFCKFLFDTKIPFRLLSWIDDDQLNSIKIDFMDWPPIIRKTTNNIESISADDVKSGNIAFKSNRFLLGRAKIYSSYCSYSDDKPITDLMPTFQQVDEGNYPKLLIEQDSLFFSKKIY